MLGFSVRTRFQPKVSTPWKTVNVKSFVRNLNLHEYQSKGVMQKYGVNTENFRVAKTPEEAEKAAVALGSNELVIKAQIHAGGRGLGVFDNGFKGGVHLVNSPQKIKEIASKMLGSKLITKQTGPEGALVAQVMVATQLKVKREFYFAIVMDRGSYGPVMIASSRGGVNIEKVAEETPELIFKEKINIFTGPSTEQVRRLGQQLGLSGRSLERFQDQANKLYTLFINADATQVEINPLAETQSEDIVALDAKLNFDDNAEFRQKEIFSMEDISGQDPREVAATSQGLSYVGMSGNIGCMVNGAGLAMATMDIIKLYHGEPANFLDVGGTADEKRVAEAFKIITADPQVKAILVNIFGGIVKCDTIAQGIINAYKSMNLTIPIIVRLAGTNVELGYRILEKSGLKMITAKDLEDAAVKATNVLKQ